MLILPKRTIVTEITELALRVLRILRLERTWPLIGAAKTAIQTEAESAGCTLAEAAASLIEDGRQVQERGESVNILALPRERRTDRMRRLDKEERKVILCNEFLDDCPLCTCGNLFLKRKHNGERFVGCDCFYDSGCSCKYSCAVPEHNPTHPLLAGITEIERAKAIIAAAPLCLNHAVPMAVHVGPHGLFASCKFFKDCTYTVSLESPRLQNEELEATSTPAQRRREPSIKKEISKAARRLFILRYSVDGSQSWDSYFLILEEHLPGGTINQFEPDDVYRTFTELGWTREHIEYMLRQDQAAAENRRRAKFNRSLMSVIQRIASIPEEEPFSVILSADALVLSSVRAKKRRMVRQKRDVFAETAAAMERFHQDLERRRAEKAERRRQRLKPCGTPASYVRGCRCEDCRAAMNRYSQEREKARRDGDYRGWIVAEAARDHILKMIEVGGSLNVLSRLVNLTHSYLHGVKTGWRKNIRADRARAIISWPPEIVAGEKKIPTRPVRVHVETLAQQGITLSRVAETTGIEMEKLEAALGRQFIPTWMSKVILALPTQAAS
jgi:hypothetical protein